MDPNQRAWSLMTRSHGGMVSVLRDLTLAECRQTYERLDPWYGHHSVSYESEGGGSYSSGGRSVNDGDIEVREVFGPSDWDSSEMSSWSSWPTHELIKLDDPRHHRNQPKVEPIRQQKSSRWRW